MSLFNAVVSTLDQIVFVINSVGNKKFSEPLISLNNATIGQHVRHMLEFYMCLINGYSSGVICYDKRKHDREIETSTAAALEAVAFIQEELSGIDEDTELVLEGDYGTSLPYKYSIKTNFSRELAYNIEHAIHHMAIIKIGMAEACPSLELPSNFGVADSTVRFKDG